MNEDPLVEEARNAGEAYCARFNHDLDAIFDDLQRRTEEARQAGRQIVSLPARPSVTTSTPSKKAG